MKPTAIQQMIKWIKEQRDKWDEGKSFHVGDFLNEALEEARRLAEIEAKSKPQADAGLYEAIEELVKYAEDNPSESIIGNMRVVLSHYRPTSQTDIVGEPPITIWDKCELHHEIGNYEEGTGDEWWLDSRDGEFQTGLSYIGWADTMHYPRKGKLVFIPEPGLTQKAKEDAERCDKWCEEEGKRMDAEIIRKFSNEKGAE